MSDLVDLVGSLDSALPENPPEEIAKVKSLLNRLGAVDLLPALGISE